MNKKIMAISILFMALIGFSCAGAVSAWALQVNPDNFKPASPSSYKIIDKGNYNEKHNLNTPFDDTYLTYVTYQQKWTKNIVWYYKNYRRIDTGDPEETDWELVNCGIVYITKLGSTIYWDRGIYDADGDVLPKSAKGHYKWTQSALNRYKTDKNNMLNWYSL